MALTQYTYTFSCIKLTTNSSNDEEEGVKSIEAGGMKYSVKLNAALTSCNKYGMFDVKFIY